MSKNLIGRFLSHICYLLNSKQVKNEKGYFLAESALALIILIVVSGSIILKFNNLNVVKEALNTRQSYLLSSNTILYEKIAPEVAKTMDVRQTVTFNINSPDYQVLDDGKKYLNCFENYTVTTEELQREHLDYPLYLASNLETKASITITRSDINEYSCYVKLYYTTFDKVKVTSRPIDNAQIKTWKGETSINHIDGNNNYYEFHFVKPIVPTELKSSQEKEEE